MKKKLRNAFLAASLAALGFQAEAQITVAPSNDSDFKLKFVGRTNLDAGTFLNRNNDGQVDNAMVIGDTRLGFVGTYQKWEGKVEICYTNEGKISFRDVTIKYGLNDHNKITFGNQFMPYGIKLTGINYKFVEDGSVDMAFCPARKVGVNYLYTTDPLNLSAGFYSNGASDELKAVNAGFNLAAQLIWRPVFNETTVFHIGGAFLYTDNANKEYKISGTTPVSFATGTRPSFSAAYGEVNNTERYEGQMLFIKSKWLLEAHVMGANINPLGDGDSKSAFGTWGQVSYQIIGDQQKYNKTTALPTNSAPGTLEVLARVDYLDLDDYGKQTDFELGFNYFINKHFNVKLNYVLASFKDRPGVDDKAYNALQTRLQFYF